MKKEKSYKEQAIEDALEMLENDPRTEIKKSILDIVFEQGVFLELSKQLKKL